MAIVELSRFMNIGSASFGQARYDIEETSDPSGNTSARLMGPPRWVLMLGAPDGCSVNTASSWESMLLKLRGRVNHLRAWDVGRPFPRGTIRKHACLASTAAAGATSISINAAAHTQNYIPNWNMESVGVNTTANLSNLMVAYVSGSTGSFSFANGTAYGGARSQRSSAAALGTTTDDRVGFYTQPIPIEPEDWGRSAVYSVYASGSGVQAKIGLYARFWAVENGGATGTEILNVYNNGVPLSLSGFAQYSLPITTIPSGARSMRLYVWLFDADSVGAASFDVDHMAFEMDKSTPSNSTQISAMPDPSVLTGDMFQIGSGLSTSQLLKATADASGQSMTVEFEPPLRQSFAAGSLVLFDRPTAYFKRADDVVKWSYSAGVPVPLQSGISSTFVENWG